MEDNSGKQLEYNACYYRNIIPKYWKTTGIDGTASEDRNKPREKLDLNLGSVIKIVITLEIAREEFMYARGICKNPEVYTWNKMYYYLYSTEYCRKMTEIFPIIDCNSNIIATFLSNIKKYFIPTLQFKLSEIFLKANKFIILLEIL